MGRDVIPVMLSIEDPTVRQAFERYLASSTGFKVDGAVHPGGLLVHELNGDADRDLESIRAHMRHDPTLEVFLVSRRRDPELLLQVMRSGIREIFTQPPVEQDVALALKRLKERKSAADQSAWGKKAVLIDIVGSKAGTGVTTTAVNLAASLLAQPGVSRVALVDLNAPYGEVSMFLDLKPAHTIDEIVRDAARLDASYLMGALSAHSSGLQVLPSALTFDAYEMPSRETIEQLLDLMRPMFEFIVVDGGEYMDEATLKAMELADHVLFVTQQSVPLLAGAKRYLRHLGRNALFSEKKIRIVLNRYENASEILDTDLEEAFGTLPYWRIPEDGRAVTSAINQGRSLIDAAPKSAAARSIAGLAAALAKENGMAAREQDAFWGIFSRTRQSSRRA